MKLRVSVALLLLLLLSTIRAASAEARDDREARARQFFAVGKYDEALNIYSVLYAETSHPTYLRNIGRCFQNLGEADKAISSFREYLRQARDLAPEQRVQIEGYIREMEELKRARAAPPPPAAAATPPPPAAARSSTVGNGAGDQPGPPGSARLTGAYVATGAAVVAVAVGSVFGLRAISKRKESDPLCPADRCNERGYSLDQQAHTAALVSDVAFGVGLVAAGTAAYLFLTAPEPASGTRAAARSLHVRPAVGPAIVGLAMGGAF